MATSAITAVTAGATVFAAGTATASDSAPVAETCTSSVSGEMGQEVSVDAASLKSLVKQGAQDAKEVLLVDELAILPDVLANRVADQKELAVAEIPEAESGEVGGDAVGKAVASVLEDGGAGLPLIPDRKAKVIEKINDTVSNNCGFTMKASNYEPEPEPSPTPSPEPTPDPSDGEGDSGQVPDSPTPTPGTDQPGIGQPTPSVPLGTGSARAPRRDYSGIPAAIPGVAPLPGARYPNPGQIPGGAPQAPQFDILGGVPGAAPGTAPGLPGLADQQPADDANVHNAGNADALASDESGKNTVQLPMLFAVVALAGVTAALVRTWVLRKVS